MHPFLSSTWSYAERGVVHMSYDCKCVYLKLNFSYSTSKAKHNLHSERAKGKSVKTEERKTRCKRTTERIKWCLSNENGNQSIHVTSRNTESTLNKNGNSLLYSTFEFMCKSFVLMHANSEQKATKCDCKALQVWVCVLRNNFFFANCCHNYCCFRSLAASTQKNKKQKKRRFNGLFLRHFFFVLSY